MYNSGCGFGQGALFAEPMDAARLGAFALTHSAPAGRARARKAGTPTPLLAAPAAGR
jgi:hypothetical protein